MSDNLTVKAQALGALVAERNGRVKSSEAAEALGVALSVISKIVKLARDLGLITTRRGRVHGGLYPPARA